MGARGQDSTGTRFIQTTGTIDHVWKSDVVSDYTNRNKESQEREE